MQWYLYRARVTRKVSNAKRKACKSQLCVSHPNAKGSTNQNSKRTKSERVRSSVIQVVSFDGRCCSCGFLYMNKYIYIYIQIYVYASNRYGAIMPSA